MTEKTTANPLLKKVGQLIRDVMGIPENLIRIGRQNFPQNDYTTSYIVIDQLGNSDLDATNEKFNGDTEVMSYNSSFKTEVTVDFYGDNAYTNARRMTGIFRSQAAFEKKRALGITVYNVSSITDVKQLTGQQYGNRLQLTMIVQENQKVDVATLRIDTAQFKILTEDKEITP